MNLKRIFSSPLFGILLGALYGLLVRIFVEEGSFFLQNGVFSITFFLITPVIISLIPILIIDSKLYENNLKRFFFPVMTVILFFIIAFVTKLEDLFCLLIIGLPYLLITGTLGLILGEVISKQQKKKKLFSLIILPIIFLPIEISLPDYSNDYKVSHSIVINKNPESIFPNLIEVPTLTNQEYKEGFFQLVGIPRPIESKLHQENGKTYRIGKFTDELQLYEIIDKKIDNQFINYKIDLKKSQLRDRPTDKHVLKGTYFKFQNIYYTLEPISANQTRVTLACDYTIASKINFYANFWANMVIKDFEVRLLDAIKLKLEK